MPPVDIDTLYHDFLAHFDKAVRDGHFSGLSRTEEIVLEMFVRFVKERQASQ